MAEIAAAPSFFTGTLEVSTNGYKAHIEDVSLNPTAVGEAYTDIGGVRHVVGGASDWVCQGNAIQDYDTANSFALFCLANDGDTVSATLKNAEGSMAFTMQVHALAFGGSARAIRKAAFSFPATVPTFTAAT